MKLFKFYLRPDQLKALAKLAKDNHCSIAEMIRRAIDQFISKEKK